MLLLKHNYSGDGSSSWHSVSTFMIPANMIDSNGDFSVEYIPPPWATNIKQGICILMAVSHLMVQVILL